MLAYPSFGPGKEFVLGAVVAHKQADNRIHPVAYTSKSLNSHERNYGISELETLELVWAVKTFRAYSLLAH